MGLYLYHTIGRAYTSSNGKDDENREIGSHSHRSITAHSLVPIAILLNISD